ncbi:unnamed protein product [Soboliphyme baturini]|uniref:SANT domain-containing protein n=1 Tax=Soboliphyme baturini TaxID=241478 RepID=A0A183J5M4_9BILA|nr:unnamed protein product [Soboliphyme baturini]
MAMDDIVRRTSGIEPKVTSAKMNHGVVPKTHPTSRSRKRGNQVDRKATPSTDPGKGADKEKDKEGVVAKSRGWEPWSRQSIKEFYNALKQFGKDFDAIQKHIVQKSKTDRKNYDQVRNFYYNTWGKISPRIDLSDIDAPKEAKELFILINYGEWQQRTNYLKIHGKLVTNFTELVRKG